MARTTQRRPVTRLRVGRAAVVRPDTLAAEEPLEIRVAGRAFAVTMRTPGHDFELAAGFLVSEGVIARREDFAAADYAPGRLADGSNTFNVVDVALAAGVAPPAPELTKAFYTTSSCGICGKASISAVRTVSQHAVVGDPVTVELERLLSFPDLLRERQAIFDSTGGLHAAGLFDAASGELLVLREDVGRHNAVDKVVGWALLNDRLPLTGCVLQVSGRASFELVQKASMAGIPVLSAVSAPSSLAADLADEIGLTLVGFVRGESAVVYTRPDRILALDAPAP
ncbi:formate dehydrogenase accessory sulfurtransferase FdhD [Serinibacter arcticus]|uniref:Sulfur carrier protein FdhD n=1 Tax=Serinibacter arcticus TaxID=1655435 RepID=A0A2U1ZWV6_9MICO|nr:formate dehydrogenase accessory sulfurtransferase FdhD [Serinibacter arcticus]PWD51402.1 formate dehydrogenase accessory sulfurtransferase FdhD [Serinibacter arcticus]